MTLPHPINIFQNCNYDDHSMNKFINNIAEHYSDIPGINGEKKISEIFIEKWIKINKCKIILDKNLRCYKLEKVNNYNKPAGKFRKAEIFDIDIIKEFTLKFSEEINDPVKEGIKLMNTITENINDGLYYV